MPDLARLQSSRRVTEQIINRSIIGPTRLSSVCGPGLSHLSELQQSFRPSHVEVRKISHIPPSTRVPQSCEKDDGCR